MVAINRHTEHAPVALGAASALVCLPPLKTPQSSAYRREIGLRLSSGTETTRSGHDLQMRFAFDDHQVANSKALDRGTSSFRQKSELMSQSGLIAGDSRTKRVSSFQH